MINLIHITAKGMPALAAAGQHAPMMIGAISGGWVRGLLGNAFGGQSLRRCLQSAMLGFAKPESFVYAVAANGSNGFGATNPPFYDNSPGKARLKLR
ncbi:MAG: hypothetical protein ACRDAM_18460 [Casimicrobium sp.]